MAGSEEEATQNKKKMVSPASARLHTRNSIPKSFPLSFGTMKNALVILVMCILGLAFQSIIPPQPKPFPITAQRIKLRDGRYLAYSESGLPRERAINKFVFLHGFDSCRLHNPFTRGLSPETIETLGIYVVAFDRPGYGESDPDPKRTGKSLALDIEELADQLDLGNKFYVIGFSMGGESVWNCLKYIPHRLAGATLLTPVVNYWWAGMPLNLTKEAYKLQLQQDQWAVRVAHYAPWLTYWWNTQKWFPPSSVIDHSPDILSKQDIQILTSRTENDMFGDGPVRQQGEYESIIRDMMIGFGRWEFSPLEDITNPFPNKEGSVHIWQGDEDGLVPVTLQRYIAKHIKWVEYHEIQGSGHLWPFAKGMPESIIKAQLSVQTH